MEKRQLGFKEMIAISIGAVIDTGIFIVPGLSVAMLGPGILWIWAAIALLSIPMGYSFAELSSMFDKSGGPILYAKAAFGSFWGFIAGWTSWILATTSIASIAIAIPFYFSFFFEISTLGKIAISVACLVVFTLINYYGAKLGAKMQLWLSGLTVVLLVAFILLGFPNVRTGNFVPLFPLGLGALGAAMVFVLEPFLGWEGCAIISSEVKNPRKLVPKAIAITTVLVAAIYFLVMFVCIGSVNWETLAASPAPLAEALGHFATFVIVMSLVINLAALNSWIFTTSRIPYAMAKEKIFLKRFQNLSKYGTPGTSLLLQAVFAAFVIFTGNYSLSVFFLLASALMLYVLCFLALIKLRKKEKPLFRAPKFFPYLSIAVMVILFTQIELPIWASGVLIVLLGIPGYVAVRLMVDKKFVEKFWDKTYMLFDLYSPFVYGTRYIIKLVANADLKPVHTVLDYGSGSGRVTQEIVKRVTDGKIVAADLSIKQIKRTLKRIRGEACAPNVICVKLTKEAPFDSNTFDRIICGLAINYFVKPEKELRALARVLKKGGKAAFLAIRAPGIPVQDFLKQDKTTKGMMKTSGFTAVSVERDHRHGREYIYIKASK